MVARNEDLPEEVFERELSKLAAHLAPVSPQRQEHWLREHVETLEGLDSAWQRNVEPCEGRVLDQLQPEAVVGLDVAWGKAGEELAGRRPGALQVPERLARSGRKAKQAGGGAGGRVGPGGSGPSRGNAFRSRQSLSPDLKLSIVRVHGVKGREIRFRVHPADPE